MFCEAPERVEEGRKKQRGEKRMTGSVSAAHVGQGAAGPPAFTTSMVRLHEKKN